MNVNTTVKEKKKEYTTFIDIVMKFRDKLPVSVPILSALDNMTADTLLDSLASWHKSCHLKFSSSKLSTALLRRKTTDSEDPP